MPGIPLFSWISGAVVAVITSALLAVVGHVVDGYTRAGASGGHLVFN